MLGRGCKRLNTTEWEIQRRHSVKLACVMAWLEHFCTDEEVCLLLCMEWSLFCFQQMTMTVDIWIEVTWQSWQYMEFVCDSVTILVALECCFVAVDGICCRRKLVGGTAEVQVRDPCILTLVFNVICMFVHWPYNSYAVRVSL